MPKLIQFHTHRAGSETDKEAGAIREETDLRGASLYPHPPALLCFYS